MYHHESTQQSMNQFNNLIKLQNISTLSHESTASSHESAQQQSQHSNQTSMKPKSTSFRIHVALGINLIGQQSSMYRTITEDQPHMFVMFFKHGTKRPHTRMTQSQHNSSPSTIRCRTHRLAQTDADAKRCRVGQS